MSGRPKRKRRRPMKMNSEEFCIPDNIRQHLPPRMDVQASDESSDISSNGEEKPTSPSDSMESDLPDIDTHDGQSTGSEDQDDFMPVLKLEVQHAAESPDISSNREEKADSPSNSMEADLPDIDTHDGQSTGSEDQDDFMPVLKLEVQHAAESPDISSNREEKADSPSNSMEADLPDIDAHDGQSTGSEDQDDFMPVLKLEVQHAAESPDISSNGEEKANSPSDSMEADLPDIDTHDGQSTGSEDQDDFMPVLKLEVQHAAESPDISSNGEEEANSPSDSMEADLPDIDTHDGQSTGSEDQDDFMPDPRMEVQHAAESPDISSNGEEKANSPSDSMEADLPDIDTHDGQSTGSEDQDDFMPDPRMEVQNVGESSDISSNREEKPNSPSENLCDEETGLDSHDEHLDESEGLDDFMPGMFMYVKSDEHLANISSYASKGKGTAYDNLSMSTVVESEDTDDHVSLHHSETNNSSPFKLLSETSDSNTSYDVLGTFCTSKGYRKASSSDDSVILLKTPSKSKNDLGPDDTASTVPMDDSNVVHDASSDSDVEKIFTVNCPSNFYFNITREEWSSIKPEGSKNLQGAWTDLFSEKFKETNPSCVLRYKYNNIKKKNSRKRTSPFFVGKAVCTHTDTTIFTFCIKEDPDETGNVEHIKVNVSAVGLPCMHKNIHVKKRKLTSRREEIGEQLTREGVSNVHYKLLAEMPHDAIDGGNFTECQSKRILSQVLYEVREREKYAKEDIADILLTKNVYTDLDNEHEKIKGYIQMVIADPFSVISFTEDQIRIMRALEKRGELVLYMDATGSVIRKVQMQPKKPFYYAVCVKNQIPGEPPLPVAEMITNNHTTVTITTFLQKLRHTGSSVYNKPVIPNRIEMDFSWAIINAALVAFCGQNIKQYLNFCWQLLTTKERIVKGHHCIIHLCCSHILKRFRDKITKLTRDKKLVQFILYCFGLLQNSIDLSQARMYFQNFAVIHGSRKETSQVRNALKFMNASIMSAPHQIDMMDKVSDACHVELDDRDQLVTKQTIKESSPFTSFFHYDQHIEGDDDVHINNEYFLPGAIKELEDLMPIFPLWGGVLIYQKEGITRDSNCHVETWFGIMKKSTLQGRKRLAPGNFVRGTFKVLKGRIEGYMKTVGVARKKKEADNKSAKLPRNTAKISVPSHYKDEKEWGKDRLHGKKKEMNIDLQEETWKKREEKVKRTYYTSPDKIPLPKKMKSQLSYGLKNNMNNCWLNSTIQALKVCDSIAQQTYGDDDAEFKMTVLKKMKRLNDPCTAGVHVLEVDDVMACLANHEDLRHMRLGRQHDPSLFITVFLHSLPEILPIVVQYSHKCIRCKLERLGNLDEAMILSVEMVDDRLEPSTQDLFQEYLKTEALVGDNMIYCSLCKQRSPHERSSVLMQCPKTLIMQIKRFNNDMEKISSAVIIDRTLTVDQDDYDLKAVQLVTQQEIKNTQEDSLLDYTLTLEKGKVVCYNDELVKEEDEDILNSKHVQENAYILYYEKRMEKTETGEEIIGKVEGILLYASDVKLLDGKDWLNDQVINAYISALTKKHAPGEIVAIDSFYLKTKQRKLPKKAGEAAIVLIPVALPCHWSIVVVWPRKQQMSHLDPSGSFDINILKEMSQKFHKDLSISIPQARFVKKEISIQNNSYDCGVYILLYAKALVEGKPLVFDKKVLKTARKQIRQELLSLAKK